MNSIPEQREPEFRALEKLAMGYLRSPQSIPKADDIVGWRFCLRLWHYPSFCEYRAWGLFQLHERGNRQVRSLVRQVTWDQQSDAKRLFQPIIGLEQGFHCQPTMEVRDRPIDTDELSVRLDELNGISFPAFATRGIGIDGETYGIEYPNHGASVEWWCEGPDSWSGLTSLASSVRNWLCSITSAKSEFRHWKRPRPKLP